jgi:chromosome segregation ATPase
MKWLPHALIAFAVATTIGVIGVARWQNQRTRAAFQHELAAAKQQLETTSTDLQAARQREREAHERLLGLDAELGETKVKLTAAESRAVLLGRELAARSTPAVAASSAEREALKREIDTLRSTWLPPDKSAAYEQRIADLLQQIGTQKEVAAQLAAAQTAATEFARDRAAWQDALAARDAAERALRVQIATLEQQLASAPRVPDRSLQLASAEETISALRRQLAERTTPPVSPAVELANLQHSLAAAKTRGDELAQQLTDSQQALAAATERERAVTDREHATAARLDETARALAELRAAAPSAETIARYQTTIADLEKRLAAAQGGRALVASTAPSASTAVFAAGSRSPSVVNVGPQNAFVILNFGSAHGARPHQSLTICRGVATLARVSLSDVREHFSIAQVEPDSLRGTLQKGDTALIAN